MKSFYQHVLRGTLFMAGLFVLMIVTSKLVTPREISKDCGIQDAAANAIQNEPENTIDVLILGDSETYSSMIPLQMWRDYGITGYCCGTSAQNLGYSLQFLQKAFEHQSPKVVILETNEFFRDFSYGEAIKYRMDRKFPVFSYHNRWKNLSGKTKKNAATTVYADNTKGYVFSAAIAPADDSDYMSPSEEKDTVSAKSLAYLQDIVDYCKKKGAKLLLVSTPSTKNWNYKRHNCLVDISEHFSVDYIDMNLMAEQIPIDWKRDSRDHGDHLNFSGATKVTDYLGRLLVEELEIPDHRGEDAFFQWNIDLEEFDKLTALSVYVK